MFTVTIVAHSAVCPWCVWHCFSPIVPHWLLFHGFHMTYPFSTVWSLAIATVKLSLFVVCLEICLCRLIIVQVNKSTYSRVPRAKACVCLIVLYACVASIIVRVLYWLSWNEKSLALKIILIYDLLSALVAILPIHWLWSLLAIKIAINVVVRFQLRSVVL